MSWIDGRLAGLGEGELRKLAKHYYRACVQTEYEISEIVCEALGWEKDPDYGYPTGDHVAATLVQLLVSEYRELRFRMDSLDH